MDQASLKQQFHTVCVRLKKVTEESAEYAIKSNRDLNIMLDAFEKITNHFNGKVETKASRFVMDAIDEMYERLEGELSTEVKKDIEQCKGLARKQHQMLMNMIDGDDYKVMTRH